MENKKQKGSSLSPFLNPCRCTQLNLIYKVAKKKKKKVFKDYDVNNFLREASKNYQPHFSARNSLLNP
jgi:hypothetical protein